MRVLNEMEIGSVNGGVCENLSIEQCVSGGSQAIINELQIAGQFIGSTAVSFFNQLQSWGGDLGIWIYNQTHDC